MFINYSIIDKKKKKKKKRLKTGKFFTKHSGISEGSANSAHSH